jgi:hypothetical protein
LPCCSCAEEDRTRSGDSGRGWDKKFWKREAGKKNVEKWENMDVRGLRKVGLDYPSGRGIIKVVNGITVHTWIEEE